MHAGGVAGDAFHVDEIEELFGRLGDVGLLTDRLPAPDETTAADMLAIIEQARELLASFYVHRSLKHALYGVDPVQQLAVLRNRIEAGPPAAPDFHREMATIFAGLRDLHTCYTLPDPYRRRIAFLPFLVEACAAEHGTQYLVTKIHGSFADPDFKRGDPEDPSTHVAITHWNGVPIERAVALNGERCGGSNPAARHARGLERLTFRWLGRLPTPDEEWVIVTYEVGGGPPRHLRFPWLVVERDAPVLDRGSSSRMSLTLAVDEEGEWIRTVKRDLHAGQRPPQALPEQPDLAQLFGFSTRAAGDRTIGYLRIYSFNVPIGRLDAFAAAVRRALRTPMDGLIVDVRGNPGGDAVAAERVLRALSPVPVKPQALEFVNTPRCVVLAGRMLSGRPEFAHNRRNALITAAQYVRSPPFDPAPDEPAQVYQGPAVLIIDSLSYSAAEIFAAGFEDHGLGKIVGTDPQTGGGGGNVLNYDALRRYDRTLPASVRGTSFEVALRRTLRVREGGGIVEDRGVVISGSPTKLTAVDVLGGNDHLFEKTAERFGADVLMHPRTLRFGVSRDRRRFSVQPSGLRRVDVYVDGRPLGSVSGAKASFVRIPAAIRKPQTVRFHGFVLDFPMAEPQVTAQWRRPDGG